VTYLVFEAPRGANAIALNIRIVVIPSISWFEVAYVNIEIF
jgi:hypothetical protein